MKTIRNSVVVGLVVLATACSSSSSSEEVSLNAGTSTEQAKGNGEGFSLEGKAACEVLSVETIANVLNVPVEAISTEAYRDKDDHKLCRYELRYSQNKMASLYINVRYNDRQDVRPNQHSDEIKKALQDGLPVDGFKDKIQTFIAVPNLGTEAAYSGNLSDNKNLIVRIGEDYFIRLEYSRYEGGTDIGDYQPQLMQLAKALLQ